MEPNQIFLIPEPEPGDMRERNAFGILKGFGKAAERYYETQNAREQYNEEITMAEHAEAWWGDKGNRVPERGTPAWDAMYEAWIDFAFPIQEGGDDA